MKNLTRPICLTWLALLTIGLAGCGAGEREQVPDTLADASTDEAQQAPESEAATSAGNGAPAEESGVPPLQVMLQMASLDAERGLRKRQDDLAPGYVLFAPILSDTFYLVDRDGQVVHTWETGYAAQTSYLLDDGSLLRSAQILDAPRFVGGGQFGRIERISWDGEVLWSWELATDERLLHHDLEMLPNGNVLAIAWDAKTPEQARAAGRRPDMIPEAGIWPDVILEIQPEGKTGGKVVWEWRYWDHLIQDHDPNADNYGEIAANPRKIDINAGPPLPEMTAEELATQKRIGFLGDNATLANRGSDLFHTNTVDYNAELDQIVISSPEFGEIFIIDHSLTTEEAATDAGDPLYRWGNPANYGRDPEGYDLLGYQHDVHWIPEGYRGAGRLMLFNNRVRNAAPPYSEVLEFEAPWENGAYRLEDGQAYGPAKADWRHIEPGGFAPFISGAKRMPNGNTLVTYGPQGRFVEVTPDGEIVWEYWTPYSGDVRTPMGGPASPVGTFLYAVFRSTFIPADHPGVAGRDLTPLAEQPAPSIIDEEQRALFTSSDP